MENGSNRSSSERECVWDYPRPPRLEPAWKHIRVEFGGMKIADSIATFRVLETSHPPVYYIPPRDVAMDLLTKAPGTSFCEWKGVAGYYSFIANGTRIDNVAWYYSKPTQSFDSIRNHVAFYPSQMDGCFVDGERVESQPGDFYGGWITSDLVGPFKGQSGSQSW